ncbi:MAG: beta-N-acetylhexosaminidase [Leptospirillia bacterium]
MSAVGRLLWVSLPGPELTAADREFLERVDPLGVVIFRENIRNAAQVRSLTEAIRSVPGSPRLLAVDQEGGRVARLSDGVPALPPMKILGKKPEEEVEAAGFSLGQALHRLGFDVDFAPVLDVDSNPQNPIIGDRAFSSDPEEAGKKALAFARGLLRAGILPCGKHFPGHGDTSLDSHVALPVVEASRFLLESRELVPFRMSIEREIPLMMTAHVVYPAWDSSVPATLSRTIITGILREKMHYQGLVLSDDLLMAAVARGGVVEAALASLDAGCDGLLVLKSQSQALAVAERLEAITREEPGRLDPARERVSRWWSHWRKGR